MTTSKIPSAQHLQNVGIDESASGKAAVYDHSHNRLCVTADCSDDNFKISDNEPIGIKELTISYAKQIGDDLNGFRGTIGALAPSIAIWAIIIGLIRYLSRAV